MRKFILITAMLLQRYRFDGAPGQVVTPSAAVTLRPRNGLPMVVRAERRVSAR